MAEKAVEFTDTLSVVALRVAMVTGQRISPTTVRRAADFGVIQSCRDSCGRRLLATDSVDRLVAHWRATGSFSGPGRAA